MQATVSIIALRLTRKKDIGDLYKASAKWSLYFLDTLSLLTLLYKVTLPDFDPVYKILLVVLIVAYALIIQ